MYDKLTKVDIDKMKEELDYRTGVLRPQILEEIKFARSHGDLSENFEYKSAKQERGKNESRIRYLTNMIKTAVVIVPQTKDGEVCIFDTVKYSYDDGESDKVRIVTTLRQDALENIISTESPLGKALIGRKAGERLEVKTEQGGYFITVNEIIKGEDDKSLDIRKY